MKNELDGFRRLTWILAAALPCLLGPEVVVAQDSGPKPAAKAPGTVKFRPPVSGAPSVRVTGGSRGSGNATIALDVLAPDGAWHAAPGGAPTIQVTPSAGKSPEQVG